jgi:hypothetical protein
MQNVTQFWVLMAANAIKFAGHTPAYKYNTAAVAARGVRAAMQSNRLATLEDLIFATAPFVLELAWWRPAHTAQLNSQVFARLRRRPPCQFISRERHRRHSLIADGIFNEICTWLTCGTTFHLHTRLRCLWDATQSTQRNTLPQHTRALCVCKRQEGHSWYESSGAIGTKIRAGSTLWCFKLSDSIPFQIT